MKSYNDVARGFWKVVCVIKGVLDLGWGGGGGGGVAMKYLRKDENI